MIRLDQNMLATLVDEVSAFVFAAECAGCGQAEVALCRACLWAMQPDPISVRTPGGLSVWAGVRYEASNARVIRALKETGQTSLLRALAPAVRIAVTEAMKGVDAAERSIHPIYTVPIPTSAASMRARGYRVPELLLRNCPLPMLRALRAARRVADQRGLDRAQRRENVLGSMRAIRQGNGASVLLIDDVITTGATFDEAARALREAGFAVIGAVAAAATPRLFDTRKDRW